MEKSLLPVKGFRNLGLCSILTTFELGNIFIVPDLLWHGTSILWSHPKDNPIQSLLTTSKGYWGSNPDPYGILGFWTISNSRRERRCRFIYSRSVIRANIFHKTWSMVFRKEVKTIQIFVTYAHCSLSSPFITTNGNELHET